MAINLKRKGTDLNEGIRRDSGGVAAEMRKNWTSMKGFGKLVMG